MAKQTLPNAQITPFEGDEEVLPFFKSQVLDLAKIHKWQDDHIVFFLKQNLKGPALKYIVQCSQTQELNTPTQIFDMLENFFKTKSLPHALSEFASFRLLPGETIHNLAHRLNWVAAKAHPTINQQDNLNVIKLNKLLEILPSEIRSHLFKHNVTTYEEAIKQAQLVQDCTISNEVLNQIQGKNSELDVIKEQLNFIKKTLIEKQEDNVKDKLENSTSTNEKQDNFYRRQNFKYSKDRSNLYKSRVPFKNYKKFEKTNTPKQRACHFCGSFQHLIRNCKKYKNQQSRQVSNQNMGTSTQFYQNWIPMMNQPNGWNWPQQIPGTSYVPSNFCPNPNFVQNSIPLNPMAPTFNHNNNLALQESENRK